MRVAVTGASSPLGQALLRRLPNSIAVHRTMTVEPCALLIHAAAPTARDPKAVEDFRGFNLQVAEYVRRWRPSTVVIGSWWQLALGPARNVGYTREKDWALSAFPDAKHLVPYSIFGPSKGFSHDLVAHITGRRRLPGLVTEPRDFIHVDDVAQAVLNAADRVPGQYAANSGNPIVPAVLARAFGVDLPPVEASPAATLSYRLPNLATPTIHIADAIAQGLARHAKQRLTGA